VRGLARHGDRVTHVKVSGFKVSRFQGFRSQGCQLSVFGQGDSVCGAQVLNFETLKP
jgi:hypothetical protein